MKALRLVPAGLLLPGAAHACAVCAANSSRAVFLFTTILLSLLPLALIGAGALWLRARARARARAEALESEKGRAPAGEPAGATW